MVEMEEMADRLGRAINDRIDARLAVRSDRLMDRAVRALEVLAEEARETRRTLELIQQTMRRHNG